MRLLLVTQDFPPAVGGIQTYSKALADCFARRTEAFGVVAPYHRGCRDLDALLPYPVYRILVPTDVMRYVLLPCLMLACARGRYRTLVLAQWYSGAAAGVAKKLGLVDRVFAAAHGQELLRVPAEGKLLGRTYARHRARVLRGIDGFFPVSRFTGSLLEELGVASERIHVVFNGTDVVHFGLSESERRKLVDWRKNHGVGSGPLLLTAARLVRRKGIDTVLQALPAIAARAPGVQYVVIGSGPERASLEALSRELGVSESVHFMGHLNEREVVLAYHACDVFVMPARMEHPSVEGFGLVFREANACGKPVIGARTGGVPDAIEHGHTGLLVEPNDPRGLAQALLELLENPVYAAKLGEQGRALVELSGTWEHAAEQMLEVMQRGSHDFAEPTLLGQA